MDEFKHLVQRIIQKDNNAFDLLYHKTKYSVYAIIYSVVKDKQTTEDLVQDTYIKMLRTIESYQPKYQFKTWLLTIAKRIAYDYYRKNKNISLIDVQEQEYLLPSTDDSIYQKMESEMFLSILTEEERTIVLLKVVDGMKHHEIGKLMNKPQGTIMWLYQKAIKKMQAYGKEGKQ